MTKTGERKLGRMKMKDSGVEWLGCIPEHWEVRRLKFVAPLVNNKVIGVKSDCQYLGLEHVISWTGKRIHDDLSESDGITTHFMPRDVLFGKLRPYLAKVYLADFVGNASTEFLVLRSAGNIFPDFLRYFMVSKDFIDAVDSSTYGVKMPRANWEYIGNLPSLVPPIPEQKTIADYLDNKTGQIDSLIGKKKGLIERLKEQRTALITHVITGRMKGEDGRLKMKDSGVEWLGDVPAHWDVLSSKLAYEIQLGKMLQPKAVLPFDQECPYLKALHVNWNGVTVANLPQMWASLADMEKYGVNNGDLLVCEGGEVGRASIVYGLTEACIIQNALHRVRQTLIGDLRYFCYVLRSIASSGWFGIICNKATIAHLTGEKLSALKIPIPPISEQLTIADYLDNKTGQIDKLVCKTEEAIAKLEEYRTSLITAAVTGKVRILDSEEVHSSNEPELLMAAEEMGEYESE